MQVDWPMENFPSCMTESHVGGLSFFHGGGSKSKNQLHRWSGLGAGFLLHLMLRDTTTFIDNKPDKHGLAINYYLMENNI